MAENYKVHNGKKESSLKKTSEKKSSSFAEEENEIKKTEAVETESAQAKVEKIETKPKKNEAVVNGRNLSVGIKHACAICNMIRGKDIDNAINMLEEVTKYKRAVPMRGEIPHRKGMMSGRYPIKASLAYIKLLKSLKSNAIQHELELEKFKIYAMPNVAPRPYKKFGAGRFKRSHVLLKLISINKTKEKK